jgi:hypothetical protein
MTCRRLECPNDGPCVSRNGPQPARANPEQLTGAGVARVFQHGHDEERRHRGWTDEPSDSTADARRVRGGAGSRLQRDNAHGSHHISLSTAAPSTTASTATATATVNASTAAKTALLTWGTRGFSAIQSLGSVVQSVDKAAHANDTQALTAACHSLATAVSHVRALLPTPDRQLTTLIQSGLNELAASATACIAGNYPTSGPELDAASTIFLKVRQRETAIAGPG